MIREAPELHIVDQDVWDAVKAKQGGLNKKASDGFWKARRPRNLISYMIKCGSCGGGCSLLGATQIGCSNARNKGTCDNRLTISREFLEDDILGALQSRLMDPDLCAIFCKEYAEHMNRLRRNRLDGVEAKRAELAKLERDRLKLVEAIKGGMPADLLREDGERISTRMEVLKHELANVEEPAPILHPAMADVYAREIQRLRETLNEEAHREEAATLIRGLIERIVLTPSEDGERLVVDLEGDLAGILAIAAGEARKEKEVGEGSVVALEAAEAVASRQFRLPAAHAAAGGRNRWLREGEFVYSFGVVGIGGCGGRI